MKKNIKVKVGDINKNSIGSIMRVIKINSYQDILVEFIEYNYITKTTCQCFEKGLVKCPYEPRVYSVGFLGEGKYNSTDENNKNTKCSNMWRHMLQRCYSEKYKSKHPTYKDCSVCEEWHNFQNFAKWYEENYYEVGNEEMHLDKDILAKNNKIYSPSTCVFVPQKINVLFTKANKSRGIYPIGITYDKDRNKYSVSCGVVINGMHKQKKIGRYDNIEKAFQCYKDFKENYIKQVADEYKPYIPRELYDAMYRYKVEITD